MVRSLKNVKKTANFSSKLNNKRERVRTRHFTQSLIRTRSQTKTEGRVGPASSVNSVAGTSLTPVPCPLPIRGTKRNEWFVLAIVGKEIINGNDIYTIVWEHEENCCRTLSEARECGLVGTINGYQMTDCSFLLERFNPELSPDDNYKSQRKAMICQRGSRGRNMLQADQISDDLVFTLSGNMANFPGSFVKIVLDLFNEYETNNKFSFNNGFVKNGYELVFLGNTFQRWRSFSSSTATFYPRLLGRNCDLKTDFNTAKNQALTLDRSSRDVFPLAVSTTRWHLQSLWSKESKKDVLFIYSNVTGKRASSAPIHSSLGILALNDKKQKSVFEYDPFVLCNKAVPEAIREIRDELNINNKILQAFGTQSSGNTCLIRTLLMAGFILDGFNWRNGLSFFNQNKNC